jgi:iron complex transport system ATP-binding protein
MILDVSGVRFSYNCRPVLEEVSFRLPHGRMLGILGVNGAGKSTLLKCINRILKPQAGVVYLETNDLLHASRREIAKRIGYVPQRHNETPLSVYESVLLGRKPHMGWAVSNADYEIVESILDQLGLTHLALRPVTDLSGGEAQKVMLGRALAQTPKVLLLDEPTSNLDLKNQLEVMGMIREIVRGQGISAVVSIHDLNLAVRFADLFLFLKDHKAHSVVDRSGLEAGTIKEVYGVDVTLREIDGQTVVVPL